VDHGSGQRAPGSAERCDGCRAAHAHEVQDTSNLKSTEQQKVETKVIESKSVIVVEQANPQVVYVLA
jgi:hypothetical protein